MRKTFIKPGILFFCILFSRPSVGQSYVWSPDSVSLADPNYKMERYHEILRYHEPVMYIAFPIVEPIIKRKISLADGEGRKGYWAEGHFGHRFVVYKGKYYTHPFFQRSRFTFDVSLLSRLTRDDSNPLLPFNGKFGFGMDYLLSGLKQLQKERATLIWTTVQFHHYSNGQADSFFINKFPQRNNYMGGDFSTNYYKLLLNIAKSSKEKNITAASLGYQREVALGGPLSSSKELQKYYGDGRWLLALQWTKKPKLVTANFRNRGTQATDTVKIERRRQTSFRTELEYITGDLSGFAGEHKGRTGWHNYFTYMPSVTNEVGFILHTYMGRDYLNIRFDDIVFIAGIGFYIRFNRH